MVQQIYRFIVFITLFYYFPKLQKLIATFDGREIIFMGSIKNSVLVVKSGTWHK